MMTPLVWTLVLAQMALGLFDILFHHELTERLAWRPSQRKELMLHGTRNLIYAVLFLAMGWLDPRGLIALAVLALLLVEVSVTLTDFVEEDMSRKLPPTERVAHTVLALNYGAILMLLIPALVTRIGAPTEVVVIDQGLWGPFTVACALAVLVFAVRDFAAAARCARLTVSDPAPLAKALGGRRRVLITGATGFIGSRLVPALIGAGHEVTVLTRDARKAAALGAPLTVVTSLDQIAADTRIDAVVNLAGEALADGLWTLAKRRRILRSRLKTTRDVRRLIARLDRRPEVLVGGSAIGWYGLRGDEVLDEETPRADDGSFSHRLCAAWEDETRKIEPLGVRVVRLRIGLVFGIDGGMLSRLLTPFEFGLGGPIGSGRPWASWIELDDTVRLIVHALATPSLEGAVNCVAPEPVRNAEFARLLGRALNRPAIIPLPGGLLRLVLRDFADELFLAGQRVSPAKALASGFRFEHPELAGALAYILRRPQASPVANSAIQRDRTTPVAARA